MSVWVSQSDGCGPTSFFYDSTMFYSWTGNMGGSQINTQRNQWLLYITAPFLPFPAQCQAEEDVFNDLVGFDFSGLSKRSLRERGRSIQHLIWIYLATSFLQMKTSTWNWFVSRRSSNVDDIVREETTHLIWNEESTGAWAEFQSRCIFELAKPRRFQRMSLTQTTGCRLSWLDKHRSGAEWKPGDISLSNANTDVKGVAVRFIFLDSQFLQASSESLHNRSLPTGLYWERWWEEKAPSPRLSLLCPYETHT